jgi:hypothetical protein
VYSTPWGIVIPDKLIVEQLLVLKFPTFYLWPCSFSAVGIATGNWLNGGGVGIRVPVESRMFTSRYRQDWLWSPPNLLFNV